MVYGKMSVRVNTKFSILYANPSSVHSVHDLLRGIDILTKQGEPSLLV